MVTVNSGKVDSRTVNSKTITVNSGKADSRTMSNKTITVNSGKMNSRTMNSKTVTVNTGKSGPQNIEQQNNEQWTVEHNPWQLIPCLQLCQHGIFTGTCLRQGLLVFVTVKHMMLLCFKVKPSDTLCVLGVLIFQRTLGSRLRTSSCGFKPR